MNSSSAGVPAERFVSVIVLNFNGERLIRRCLDHLLRQTYARFEIIVVDNGSSDGSVSILEEYLPTGKVSVVCSPKNLGCPGGRNLGLLHATGDVIGFMDNDGYAHPGWLERAMRVLESGESIGAVAPVVFFAKRPLILNGVGGTLNYQGYGCDFAFKMPYEFAKLPDEVLYPMGCGMVVRRSALDRAGPFDDALLNYYDDAELGIRLRKLGYRVSVAPDSWVDHELSFSEEIVPGKAEMCEKGRIRTALKYLPLQKLVTWLPRELAYGWRYGFGRRRLLRAWVWNLLHLGSVLGWRLRLRHAKGSYWQMLHPSWGMFPPPIPGNEAVRPDPERSTGDLPLDGHLDKHQLNFGWYHAEKHGEVPFRWTDVEASALLRVGVPARSLVLEYCSPARPQRIEVVARRLGELTPAFATVMEAPNVSWHWQRKEFACPLSPGVYEMLLLACEPFRAADGRTLGIAVSRIALC